MKYFGRISEAFDRTPALKWILYAALFLMALWALAPRRSDPVVRQSDVVEITFMGPGGPLTGALDDLVREFERIHLEAHRRDPTHPVYRVIAGQSGAFDQVSDPTRFLISVAGGEPPDVIWFDRFAVAEWAARGAFLPLDDFIARDRERELSDPILPEDFYDNVWAESVYNGKVYAIPNGVDDRILFYNKDLLKREGFVDPKTGEVIPPRTWEQLREYHQKITRRDANGKLQRIGFAPNYGNSWLYLFGWMAGGEFMSEDGKTCTLNDPRIARGLQFMVDLYNDAGGYDEVLGFQAGFQANDLDPFIVGKVGMVVALGSYSVFLAQYGKDLDFGASPVPLPSDRLAAGAPPVSWNGGWSYAIPFNALHKDAAWEFIRFAASEKGFEIWTESLRETADILGQPFIPDYSPRRKQNEEFIQRHVYDNPQLPDRVKDSVRVAMDLLPHAKYRPVTPVGQLLWSQHVIAMEDACFRRKSPQEALDYCAAVVQRDLDRYLAPREGVPFNVQWFFVAYVVLILAGGTGVFWWDTHPAFRGRVARMLGFRERVGVGDTVEGSRGGYFRKQWLGGFLCASPWILGFLVFGGGPLLYSVVMSFCDYDVLSPARFTGLHNFKVLFTEDELAPKSLFNTLFMLLGVPIGIAAGLCVALLLNLRLRGMQIYRTLFYLPAIMPAVAMMMLWIWMFNPVGGPLNRILEMLGLPGQTWLSDKTLAKPSILLMGLWGVGGSMIIWLAGLRNIPAHLYEAASIDGASAWQQFRHITIPQLTPYIFFYLIMGLIAAFQIFDEAFIMTRGGPANATTFYVYHLFNNAFRYGHMGYACAMAWALFVCVLGFTIVQMGLARKWVHYETD